MAVVDADFCELFLTIKSYASSRPYIDPLSGLTTQALPYEACEYTETMYEAGHAQPCEARITFPSLINRPDLRPLLQMVKEGDRVELYAFQPDCGSPVFGGNIRRGGKTEAGGSVQLDVGWSLEQGSWQHVRRGEEFNDPVSALCDRALRHWVDIHAEDFAQGAAAATQYASSSSGSAPLVWNKGSLVLSGTPDGVSSGWAIWPTNGFFLPTRGDVYCLQTTFSFAYPAGQPAGVMLIDLGLADNPTGSSYVVGRLQYDYQLASADDYWRFSYIASPSAGGSWTAGNQAMRAPDGGLPRAVTITVTLFVKLNQDGTATTRLYHDNTLVDSMNSVPWPDAPTVAIAPYLTLIIDHKAMVATVTSWRFRKLAPYLAKASNFATQTLDPVYYLANNEDNVSFLNLWVQKDSSEYRLRYLSAPAMDEMELGAIGTLGQSASLVLGYGQPGAGGASSPKGSPFSVVTDAASFLFSPPFRFEEGHNLADTPRVAPPAILHTNNAIRMGSNQLDAQMFAEAFSVAEIGSQDTGLAAQFPVFESITNDDRVGLIGVVRSLAALDLQQGIDPTPSLEVAVVEQLQYAFGWRAGDRVFTKTLSLLNNLEQDMRVMRVQYMAGSPVRTVTLGRLEYSPDQLRELMTDMTQSWLYEQSGSSALTFVYPMVPASTFPTATFPMPVDQFNSGTAITYAGLHWFVTAGLASQVSASLNGAIYTTNAGGTDSGLIDVTDAFAFTGKYSLSFSKVSGTPTLGSAFVVIRIKM